MTNTELDHAALTRALELTLEGSDRGRHHAQGPGWGFSLTIGSSSPGRQRRRPGTNTDQAAPEAHAVNSVTAAITPRLAAVADDHRDGGPIGACSAGRNLTIGRVAVRSDH